MCRLCSEDENEVKSERNQINYIADKLEQIARHYRSIAKGDIKPHTDNYKSINAVVCTVIRYLVDEWV